MKLSLNFTEPNQELLEKLTMSFNCASYEEFFVIAMGLMDQLRSKQEMGFNVLIARNATKDKNDRITMPMIKSGKK